MTMAGLGWRGGGNWGLGRNFETWQTCYWWWLVGEWMRGWFGLPWGEGMGRVVGYEDETDVAFCVAGWGVWGS